MEVVDMLWWKILSGIAGYVAISTLALFFPLPCFRRKSEKSNRFPPTIHCSHRGGAYERHENTLEAFRHAFEDCNTDMLELDVRITKCGEVVVCHDRDLRRLTGQIGSIFATNYEDFDDLLPSNDLLVPYAFDNKKLNETMEHIQYQTTDREPICTLQEAFEMFPQAIFNIDIKHDNDELIQKVHSTIKRYNRKNITIWGSMIQSASNKMYKLDPEIQIFFPVKSVITLFLKYFTGLLPFIPIRETFIEIPLITESLQRRLKNRFGTSRKIRFAFWLASYCLRRRWLYMHLQRRGVRVIFWVLNSVEDFESAFELGADGVMTDRPTLLREYLMNRPKPSGERDPLYE